VPLIVELLTAWVGLSLVLGLPLGRAIRRADVREFPLRDSPWWCDVTDDRRDLDRALLRPRVLPV
jgi:hypothetical protein